jgi:hypothetical protein
MDNIKVIITDLFLLMYENKAFERDTQRLTKNIINDYLESDLCKKQFATLVTEQALQNTEHVVRPLHNILMNYLKTDYPRLLNLSEQLLLNIGNIEQVKYELNTQIHNQICNSLASEYAYSCAITGISRQF